MDVGKIIVELRKGINLKQGELAKRVGITQASLSHIENGNTKNPSNNSLLPICEVLEISIAELYILALDENDYPEKHKVKFKIILPAIKSLVKSIRE